VSVGALVAQVGEVLSRAHSLFGAPSGGAAALDAGSGLAGAADGVRRTGQQISNLAGALPAHYRGFARDAVRALDAAAGTDTRVGGAVGEAGRADGSGWASSGAVLSGAHADTAGLAPVSGTPAGQRALIAAWRARLAQQQQVVNACRARDARLAAAVRALAYSRGAGGGGSPWSALPVGAAGFGKAGGSPLSGWSGLSGLASLGYGGGGRNRRAALVNWDSAPGRVPGEPGEGAAKAALSRLGCPYVWGAKGPSRFDCSGLTQWAWRQAGVLLGNDTHAQITEGVAVPPGQVRAGDLIFPVDAFGEGGRSGPGHVQLAISDHQVVHAPTAGDVVRIAPMPGRYIARRPVRPMLA
jgi:peptidoglycan DL-endopeptidase CwlO